MPGAIPQKRVLADSTNTRQNVTSTPPKKRKVDALPSSPAIQRLSASQRDRTKLSSSQPKSTFESDVLEKLSQDISELKQNNAEKDQSWARPPVPALDPEMEPLIFQSIEAEEGYLSGGRSTVKLFGVTEQGNSVMLHVADFKHYLYVPAPISFQPSHCKGYKTWLESSLGISQASIIHSVEMVMRMDMYEYQGNVDSPFLKITVTDPRNIARLRTHMQKGNGNWQRMWGDCEDIRTYDNIPYLLRFMVDTQVSSKAVLGRCTTWWRF